MLIQQVNKKPSCAHWTAKTMSWRDTKILKLDTFLVRGRISCLRKEKKEHDFITNTRDRFFNEAGTLTGAAAGSTVAPGLVTMAGDNYEKAERVYFEVGEKIFEGWLWEMPFDEGDEVEVVAVDRGDKNEVLAVRRVADSLLAIYPHATRGRSAHKRQSFFWSIMVWIYGIFATSVLVGLIDGFGIFLRGKEFLLAYFLGGCGGGVDINFRARLSRGS